MTTHDIMIRLGEAFSHGDIDGLAPYLAESVTYDSDYSHVKVDHVEPVISHLKSICSKLNESEKYSYRIIKLDDYSTTRRPAPGNLAETYLNVRLNEEALLLYQYDTKKLVAVVEVNFYDEQLIWYIHLSRSKTHYKDLMFYGEEIGTDSSDDLPSTVKALTPHDRQLREMQQSFAGQKLRNEEEPDDPNYYIWQQADKYFKRWLKDNGYTVLESKIFEDCIGYRCHRNGYAYTIYMYAYGQRKTAMLDGESCSKFLTETFSANSIVLIAYLSVKRVWNGDGVGYWVGYYCDAEHRQPEMWTLEQVNGAPVIVHYLRKEFHETTYQFMYAFNHDDLGAYACILDPVNRPPSFRGLEHPSTYSGMGFYTQLLRLHKTYGDMKLLYVRINDVIHSIAPYLEGYGFFHWEVDHRTNKIFNIRAHPFEPGELKFEELILTQEKEVSSTFGDPPPIQSVTPLASQPTERFAVKLQFCDGTYLKYVLPIPADKAKDEVISYMGYVFSDGIWASARLVETYKPLVGGYPDGGQAIAFKNGFILPALLCCENGSNYKEPELCDQIAYQDDAYTLKRAWRWNVEAVYEDKETGLMKTLLSGQAFNYYGTSTYATPDGYRLTSLNFDLVANFSEGLARVAVSGHGWGYIDPSMSFIIPMQYDEASDFHGGYAKVRRGSTWCFIDRTGKETPIIPEDPSKPYQEIGELFEGLCRVSTLKLRIMDLAYHSDYDHIAGTWGFVDSNGKVVIPPQYIYANDFEEGIAIVCKGKWTIDKKWDNKYNTGKYWTEEELWGGIDLSGKEVIPFIFDEIKCFNDTREVFMAHYGGWENGAWGVIDTHGRWLAEPVFKDLGYEYCDGLFAFYAEDKWDGDDVPLGIYDLKQHRVLFDPQFYDVSFSGNGWIEVETYDANLDRRIEKIIDRTGKERFPSIYTSIYTWRYPYEVVIREGDRALHGLINEDGAVLVPCEYEIAWDGFKYDQQRIVFEKDGKQGVMDFDGKIIIDAKYHELHCYNHPFFTAYVGTKEQHTAGLITLDGREVLPPIYEGISWCEGNRLICRGNGYCEMFYVLEHKSEHGM